MKDRTPREGELDELRKAHARRIVGSVFTEGVLLPADQVTRGRRPLRSMDNFPYICGAFVFPPGQVFEKNDQPDSDFQHLKTEINGYPYYGSMPSNVKKINEYLLQEVLYGSSGIRQLAYKLLPVLVERDNEDYTEWTANLAQRRMMNSILVVIPSSQINAEDIVRYDEELEKPDDIRLGKSLSPEAIKAIIVPEGLQGDLEGLLGDERIVKFVGNRRREVLAPVIRGELVVPDYEKGLLEVMEEIGEPVFIHGVRLPTEEDVLAGRIG